jgi:deazaflavin-dependent oxidoreductase (nitroreductase family)
VVRAPIMMYRARLGWLLGPRLLMLEHRGRTTGQPRFAVLEVIDRPFDDAWVVVAGFGDRAQWLRNVRTDPHVKIWAGSRRPLSAVAREMPVEQGVKSLRHYAARHPFAWRRLRPVLEETLGSPIDLDATTPPVVLLAGSRTQRAGI